MPLTRPKPRDQKPTLIDVPLDTAGRLSDDYVDHLEAIGKLEKELDTIGGELIKVLKTQGRESIFVRGVNLKVKEVKAKFGISVKRVK